MKKSHKNYLKTISKKKSNLKFGTIGFKIMSPVILTTHHLSCLDQLLKQKLKNLTGSLKTCKVWQLVQVNTSLTKQSLESRMGKGKGNIWTKVVFLKAGSIFYEFSNVQQHQINILFSFLQKQIPSTKLKLIKYSIKERET